MSYRASFAATGIRISATSTAAALTRLVDAIHADHESLDYALLGVEAATGRPSTDFDDVVVSPAVAPNDGAGEREWIGSATFELFVEAADEQQAGTTALAILKGRP